MDVIFRGVGFLVFSYFNSLVKFTSNCCSIFKISESSTDKVTPLTNFENLLRRILYTGGKRVCVIQGIVSASDVKTLVKTFWRLFSWLGSLGVALVFNQGCSAKMMLLL